VYCDAIVYIFYLMASKVAPVLLKWRDIAEACSEALMLLRSTLLVHYVRAAVGPPVASDTTFVCTCTCSMHSFFVYIAISICTVGSFGRRVIGELHRCIERTTETQIQFSLFRGVCLYHATLHNAEVRIL